MITRTDDMEQVATYWPPGVNDGFGNLSFASVEPVLIACRWQDDAVLFRAPSGDEETSSAIVYPDRVLAVKGQLALGDHAGTAGLGVDPRDAGAREIRQVGSSPSLSADEVLYKVYL
jgi:hypothetical protein